MSADAAAPSGDVITLRTLSIEPSAPAPIEAPLKLAFAFDAARELPEAFWDFKVRGRRQREGEDSGRSGQRRRVIDPPAKSLIWPISFLPVLLLLCCPLAAVCGGFGQQAPRD